MAPNSKTKLKPGVAASTRTRAPAYRTNAPPANKARSVTAMATPRSGESTGTAQINSNPAPIKAANSTSTAHRGRSNKA